ncbi:MAG: BadF/BadG/BcrA/BcrD ATPase family protein [Brachybacterium sp.]|nr:BadF/BadG/BcrA/BcrD ATPase family protein [Brachybacterium sp.]
MSATPAPLLLAADVGGTSSRVAIVTADGTPVAEATGGGCNLRSSGPAALDALRVTAAEALGDRDGADVHRAVLAIAGAGPAAHGRVTEAVRDALGQLGIPPGAITVTDDLAAAFLSGGVGEDGVLLLAGTGAVAARFERGQMVSRTDGMGWLLGDIGSGVWLGRRVLEAVAADLDDRGPRTALTERLGEQLGLALRDGSASPTRDVRQDLIAALDGLTPAQWGRFAPLPGQMLPDPVAREILDTAARALIQNVHRLDPGHCDPVVLAGGVLTGTGPLREELITGLEAAGRTVATATSGLAGALHLAQQGTA